MKLLRINHLGIATTGLAEAMARMARLFDMEADHLEAVPEQKVKTAFFRWANPAWNSWRAPMLMVPSASSSPSAALASTMSA